METKKLKKKNITAPNNTLYKEREREREREKKKKERKWRRKRQI